MQRDTLRLQWISESLGQADCDALVCTLPAHVLMMSGYCPVVGDSWAIATRTGQVVLLIPEDEHEPARHSWAHEVRTFAAGSLDHLSGAAQAASHPLSQLLNEQGLAKARVAVESGECFQPATYISLNLYGSAGTDLLHQLLPQAQLYPAGMMIQQLTSRYTPHELQRIADSCVIAQKAYEQGIHQLHPGLTERQAAGQFRSFLQSDTISRLGGDFFCMSGPNSFESSAAFQISRSRNIQTGDLLLIHCNSSADGFWTDITRTYCMGEPTELQWRMTNAIYAAREAGLAAIFPGRRACMVDAAVRSVMTDHGFGEQFVHPTGHGVGFFAINHNALPRIHPKSEDILREGMVFNIEPGIYIPGYGGMRHCDMVAVAPDGVQILTNFQQSTKSLSLSS